MPKFLIVDDHAVLRRRLRQMLRPHVRWQYCGESASGEEGVQASRVCTPDVIIMDVSMPGIGGVQATHMIHAAQPNVKIVLLTLHNSVELLRAGFTAGACGYVLKSDPDGDLVRALDIVADGGMYITTAINPVTAAAVLQELNELRRNEAVALARKAATS